MDSTRTSILYVSNVAPGQRGGGSIIIDRHLRHLASLGHAVTVLLPEGAPPAPSPVPWRTFILPSRRAGWPPFRPNYPLLCRLRSTLVRLHLKNIGLGRHDQVLTICAGNLSWLAADLARTWDAPLTTIVHDWWEEFGSDSDSRCGVYCCRRARTVLTVSQEMSDALAPVAFGRTEVLPPVPAARTFPQASWRDSHARMPVVAHVGTLHPHHVPYLSALSEELRRLGGNLLVICDPKNAVWLQLLSVSPGIIHHPYFATQHEALEHVLHHASAFTVMYPNGTGPAGRPFTGFPSRLIEFSQLGLPALLVAPPGNPLRTWAESKRWKSVFSPDDLSALRDNLQRLTQRPHWEQMAGDTARVAAGEFDPEAIHRRLATLLSRP